MKTVLVLLAATFLSGCSIFKPRVEIVKPDFPTPYVDKQTNKLPECQNLTTIDSNQRDMQSVFNTIVKNYVLYWQCNTHVEGWNKWYTEQKKIYDSVK